MRIILNRLNNNIVYIFLYFLYLLLLLPKEIQAPIIFLVFLILLIKNKFKIWTDKTGFLLSLVGIIQIISIIINIFTRNIDFIRILAAFNTASLWVLCGCFYSYVKKNGLNSKKVNRTMFINMIILILLSILMIVLMNCGITDISFLSRNLMRNDWSYGIYSHRFRGFLLYDTLVPMMYFLIFPFAFEYVNNVKSKILSISFTIISLLPLYLSKSRMGIILGIVLFLYILFKLTTDKLKRKSIIIILIAIILLIFGILYHQKIIDIVMAFINSRSGSTSTRMKIYSLSIEKAFNINPFIGCGVKEMLGSFPYGSHSTYIGLFYKVGLLGSIVGVIALFKTFKEVIYCKYYYIISAILLSIMFITEDIDGENWLIILFGILFGLIAYQNKINKKKKHKKINVLQVVTGGLRNDGITLSQLDIAKRIDKNKFKLDYLAVHNDDYYIINEFKNNNCDVIKMLDRKKHLFRYIFKLKKIIKKNDYDVIHVHGSSALLSIELSIAKKCGVPVRIAHSRNTTCNQKKLDKLLRRKFYKSYNVSLACGEEAGKWLFGGRDFITIHNGKDLKRFTFDSGIRKTARKELGLKKEIAYGHVGGFNTQKNHEFLIESFNEIHKKNKNTKLFLFGSGNNINDIKELVKSLKLEDSVIFCGSVSNIEHYLQAMDIMLFPSKYEGLPNVLIEWQSMGLPCVISNKITDECIYSKSVYKLAIDNPKDWAMFIDNLNVLDDKERNNLSISNQKLLKKNGFEIKNTVESYEKIYISEYRKKVNKIENHK